MPPVRRFAPVQRVGPIAPRAIAQAASAIARAQAPRYEEDFEAYEEALEEIDGYEDEDELFDADELGLDTEEDDERRYR